MQHTCTVCHCTFETPRKVSKYCSNRCGAKASYQARKAAGSYQTRRKLYELTCTECGSQFTRGKSTGQLPRFCSLQCSARNAAQLAAIANRKTTAVVVYVRPAVTHIRTARRLTSGRCRVCTAWFVSLAADVTCSSECRNVLDARRRRTKYDRRRAAKISAFVEPVDREETFKRDGYRCHLCRKLTLRNQVVPHPRAPTIDHVIPLAAGGTHEPLNCRTACFACNSRKRDRGGGEQLLLIA